MKKPASINVRDIEFRWSTFNKRFEIVKWETTKQFQRHCYVIAFFDPEEDGIYSMRSVGNRFFTTGDPEAAFEVASKASKALNDSGDQDPSERPSVQPAIFVEEFVFQPPEGLENYRYFRIEYGGVNEESIMTGSIWVHRSQDPDAIEELLNKGAEQ